MNNNKYIDTYLNVSQLLESEADNFNGMLLVNTLKDVEKILYDLIQSDQTIDEKTKHKMETVHSYKMFFRKMQSEFNKMNT